MSVEKKAAASAATSEAKAQKAAASAASVTPVAWCGPTIKGIAPQYTVFLDGLPQKLSALAEESAVVKALIVPRERLADMRMKIEREGSRENLLCKNAAALLK